MNEEHRQNKISPEDIQSPPSCRFRATNEKKDLHSGGFVDEVANGLDGGREAIDTTAVGEMRGKIRTAEV